MRGAHLLFMAFECLTGIIPADAGSTTGSHMRIVARWDHPRGCGEHHQCGQDSHLRLGSSPRMRGAHRYLHLYELWGRIIPADAGSTHPMHKPNGARKDHPRGCGEHHRQPRNRQNLQGSSPRMRGARNVSVIGERPCRIIPADAGSTSMPS